MTDTTEPKKKSHWRLWILGVLLLLIGLPALLFFAASLLVNRVRIPEELAALPPDWAAPLERSAPALTARGEAEATTFTVARRTHGSGPMRDGMTEYDRFLEEELRERPDLEGARLYLELFRRFQSKEGVEELNSFDRDPKRPDSSLIEGLWRPGEPLPAATAEWLTAHGEIIALFLRFGESPGLPVRTRELFARNTDTTGISPVPNFTILVRGQRILAAEGQRRLEAGDAAGADRLWRAALRMTAGMGREPFLIGKVFGEFAFNTVIPPLAGWIENGGASPEALAYWRQTLAATHRDLFPHDILAEDVETGYPGGRKWIIDNQLNGPWWSEVFGWDVTSRIGRYSFSIGNKYLGNWELPRVGRITLTTLRAIRNKRDTPRLLHEMDQYQQEMARRGRMTWPEFVKAGPCPPPKNNPLFAPDGLTSYLLESQYTRNLARILAAEARLNLLRVAVERRLAAPGDTTAPPGALRDREDPWRDPFTEAPLRAADDAAGAGATFYSLGPDTADQRAQILYDPTNGTLSAGDVWLDPPR